MELSRILITEYGDHQVIFLKEKNGERSFPIMIGIAEAMAIDHRVKGHKFPRPMTHDLLGNVIEALGGRLERIVIGDLRRLSSTDSSQTFIATLYIRRGEDLIEVDSRPSDAIALGVAFETPIFVAERVLESVLSEREPSTTEERLAILRRRMEMLNERIAELSARLDDEAFLAKAPQEIIAEHRRQLAEMQTEYEAIERVLKKLG